MTSFASFSNSAFDGSRLGTIAADPTLAPALLSSFWPADDLSGLRLGAVGGLSDWAIATGLQPALDRAQAWAAGIVGPGLAADLGAIARDWLGGDRDALTGARLDAVLDQATATGAWDAVAAALRSRLGGGEGRSLVVIDGNLADYEQLLAGLDPTADVMVLDPSLDGVAQLSAALAGRSDLESLQIVSHGGPGSLRLGNGTLDAETLAGYGPLLDQWRSALAPGADLLLYGCDVAAGDTGTAFLQALHDRLGVDVAASTDRTGSAILGADWDLEAAIGVIESTLAIGRSTLDVYGETLAAYVIAADNASYTKDGINTTISDSLKKAFDDAIGTAAADTITLAAGATYTLTVYQPAPVAGDKVTINGNGATIQSSGTGTNPRIFLLANPNIDFEFKNLTLQGGVTTTGSSHGGAVYINNDATKVSFNQVTFSGNKSAGNGGAIALDKGTLTLKNSTFSDNQAAANGGAIAVNLATATATLDHVTIVNNKAVNASSVNQPGGGVSHNHGTVTVTNSLILGNTGTNDYNKAGTLAVGASSVQNIIGTTNATWTNASDANGADPLTHFSGLAAFNGNAIKATPGQIHLNTTLTTNPGKTSTLNLNNILTPALDKATTTTGTDQIDQAVSNGRRDIGAFEYQQTLSPPSLDSAALDCELPDITEDLDPMANVGMTVGDIITDGDMQDANGNTIAPESIAISEITTYPSAAGTWEYKLSTGPDWTVFPNGVLIGAKALLLDSDDRVRFSPATDYNNADGTVIGFWFNAWDKSDAKSPGTIEDIPDPLTWGDPGSPYSLDSGRAVISITEVNDAPTLSLGTTSASATVGGAAQTIDIVPTAGPGGGTDESGQALTYEIASITDTSSALAAGPTAGPTIDATTGKLTFTPSGTNTGTAEVKIVVKDNGTTAGAADAKTSTEQTFTITVTAGPVGPNNPPVLDSAQTPAFDAIQEDQDPATIAGKTVGDLVVDGSITDVDGAVKAIAVTAVDNANGTWQYSLDAGTNWTAFGTPTAAAARLLDTANKIRFVPKANYKGTSNITFRAWDKSAGAVGVPADTTGAGASTSPYSLATDTAALTINAVNDAPTFTKGADQVVNAGQGPQTVTGWATGFAAGGGDDEAGQTIAAYVIKGNDKAALFDVGPAIDVNGNLTFTPVGTLGTADTATIQVAVQDSGSGVAPNVNESTVQTFTIQVNPVGTPVPPVANNDTGTTTGTTPVKINVIANDTDANNDIDPTSVKLSGTTPTKGTATSNADGTITYTPNAAAIYPFTDIFTYTVDDKNATTATSNAATVIVTVNAPIAPPPPPGGGGGSVPPPSGGGGAPITWVFVDGRSIPDDSTTPVDFGAIAPGSAAVKQFQIFNQGSQILQFGGLQLPAGFSLVGTFPPSLAPGERAVLQIAFTGTSPATYEGMLAFGTSDTSIGAYNFPLIGTILDPNQTGGGGTPDDPNNPGDPANQPPIAQNNTVTTAVDAPIQIDILGNDSDPDGRLLPDSVQVIELPQNGQISIDPNSGAIRYVPNPGFVGTDTLRYTVLDDDLATSNPALVTINIDPNAAPPTEPGTPKPPSDPSDPSIDLPVGLRSGVFDFGKFVKLEIAQGLDPINIYFNEAAYLAANPDAVAAIAAGDYPNAFAHYVQKGQFEGRDPGPLFDESLYLEQNPDVAAHVGPGKSHTSGFEHFIEFGQFEGRDVRVGLFDPGYYQVTYPDVVANLGTNDPIKLFEHFLTVGQLEGRNPSPLFNAQYYLERYPEVGTVIAAGQAASPFDYFIHQGLAAGHVPTSYFNAQTYAENNPDVTSSNQGTAFRSVFDQFLHEGLDDGRASLVALFDENYYLSKNPGVREQVAQGQYLSAIDHFLLVGQYEGRAPSARFDPSFYLNAYPDVGAAIEQGFYESAFDHFATVGRHEGRMGIPA